MATQSKPLDLLGDIPRGNPDKYLNEQTLPQSRFQLQRDVEEHAAYKFDPKRPDGMVLLGAIGANLYGVRDDRHLTTFAGTRAGKTVTVISNHHFYNGSTLNNDSKGSITKAVAERRAAMGHTQRVLDPYEIIDGDEAKFRCQFNPVKSLRIEDIDVIENAYLIVDAMVVETGNESDIHWNESAKNFLLGLVLYVAFGSNVKEERRHLATVRTFLNIALSKEQSEPDKDGNTTLRFSFPHKVKAGLQTMKGGKHWDIADTIESNILGLYEMGKEEKHSVLSTAKRHTAFLQFRGMACPPNTGPV